MTKRTFKHTLDFGLVELVKLVAIVDPHKEL